MSGKRKSRADSKEQEVEHTAVPCSMLLAPCSASSNLPHAGVELHERRDHHLSHLVVDLPFFGDEIRELESRAQRRREAGIECQLHLGLPAERGIPVRV